MNIINKLFKKKNKKKQKHPLHSVNLHFVNTIRKYHCDKSYHKTINILQTEILIIVYYKHLDVHIGKIYTYIPTTFAQLSVYINNLLINNMFLLTDVNDFTMYTGRYVNNMFTNSKYIDQNSTKNILDAVLQYNINKSYCKKNSIFSYPLSLHVMIEPIYIPPTIYINYKRSIIVCKLQECFICFETKYLNNICPNRHYICFACIKKMRAYKKNKCPYCNTIIKI